MATEDSRDGDKVKLSVEIQDLIELVSKSSNKLSLSQHGDRSTTEAEELKKAWFKHLLVSLEKLHDLVENVRRTDLPEIKKDFKEELNKLEVDLKKELAKIEGEFRKAAEKLEEEHKKDIAKLETRVEKIDLSIKENEVALTKYKTDIIGPMSTKLTELAAKMALIGVLAGGIASIIYIIIKELLEH